MDLANSVEYILLFYRTIFEKLLMDLKLLNLKFEITYFSIFFNYYILTLLYPWTIWFGKLQGYPGGKLKF